MSQQELRSRSGMRPRWLAACLVALVGTTGVGAGDQVLPEKRARSTSQRTPDRPGGRSDMNKPTPGHDDPSSAISRLAVSPARTFLFTEEREAAARVFVKKNVPELDAVLDQLKLSKPDEYQKVIYDLFHTSERFAVMRQEDQGHSELALRSWQVEARTQVLAARLVAHPDQGERLMAELHKAVEVLADLQVEQAAYEVRRLEDKVRRAEGQRKIIASRRNEFVNQRLEAILQAVGRAEAGQKESSQPNR